MYPASVYGASMRRIRKPWKTRAEAALAKLAASGKEFSANDLYEMVGLPDPSSEPNAKNNTVGTMFRHAAHRGEIRFTGKTILSTVPTRKGGLIRVWIGTGD